METIMLVSCRLNFGLAVRSAWKDSRSESRTVKATDRYRLPDPISLPESPRMFNEGWLGETRRVYVRACVIRNSKMRKSSWCIRGNVDLAQWALECNNLLFSFPLASPLSPSNTMFLLSLLSLEFTLQGCFLQFNLILILAAHPLFNKSNINILCSFHFLNIMNFPK